MSFGLNLSFCVKCWVTPALWAPRVGLPEGMAETVRWWLEGEQGRH